MLDTLKVGDTIIVRDNFRNWGERRIKKVTAARITDNIDKVYRISDGKEIGGYSERKAVAYHPDQITTDWVRPGERKTARERLDNQRETEAQKSRFYALRTEIDTLLRSATLEQLEAAAKALGGYPEENK